MPDEPRTRGLARWLRGTIESLTGERYVSKIATTGKGNHWFTICEPDGHYIVHVKKIDPEDM